ncbi:MAG: gluconokinase [Muribaculaceae bacterium]|nr:gluconokinase [Muribaculaceae bacterium]
MSAYYLGIDLGTTNIKAVLFDEDGYQKGIASTENKIFTPAARCVECDPEMIFSSALQTMKACLDQVAYSRKSLCGIGLSTQSHNIFAVDQKGACLCNALIWADTRAQEEAQGMERLMPAKTLYGKTGCYPKHPLYPLSKVLWMRNHLAGWNGDVRLAGIKDYILERLYGKRVTDYTNASCHGFFNIHQHDWDMDILRDVLKLDRGMLSDVVPCNYVLRRMRREYAAYLDIPADTPFIVGSNDGACASIGSGVFSQSGASCSIGTSGAIRTMVSIPRLAGKMQTWCYSVFDDQWIAGGATNNAGIALRWLKETYSGQYIQAAKEANMSVYELFSAYAEDIPIGCDGLTFLPYFTGERSPDWNDKATGIMYGLSLHHTDRHIIRAAMEGALFRLYEVFLCMKDLGCNMEVLHASGGYAKSDVWLQMQADLFGTDIQISEVTEGAALGAAYLAMQGVGRLRYGELLDSMKSVKRITANPNRHELYQNPYLRAKELYDHIYGRSSLDAFEMAQ